MPENEFDVERWIAEAGPRAEIPTSQAPAILATARAEWLAAVATRPPAPARRWLAAAGLVLAALVAGWWWRTTRTAVPGAPVARLERWQGAVRIGGVETLGPDAPIAAGAHLEIADRGALALRVAGRSLRFDAGTAARLVSADEIALERGALYVDGLRAAQPGLIVRTPLGEVREVGTQFEVRLLDDGQQGLRVRVREGRVAVRASGTSEHASAGEELHVRRDGGARRATIAPDSEDWRWAIAAAPAYAIEGVSLGSFLDWLARETGWRIEFADAELERAARPIQLHGTIEGLSPEEAVAAVVPGSGLTYRLERGTLRISREVKR